MPFLVRWLAQVKVSSRVKVIGLNVDFAPTFLDAAGLAASRAGHEPAQRCADGRRRIGGRRCRHHFTIPAIAARAASRARLADLLLEEGSVNDVDLVKDRLVHAAGQGRLTGTLKAEGQRLKAMKDDDQLMTDQQPTVSMGRSPGFATKWLRASSSNAFNRPSIVGGIASPRT